MFRAIAFATAIAAVTVGNPVRAGEATPESVLVHAARLMQRIHADQDKYCAAPRSNDSASCKVHFEATYPKLAEFAALKIVYLSAASRGDPKADEYKTAMDQARAIAEGYQRELEVIYYPEVTGSVDKTN